MSKQSNAGAGIGALLGLLLGGGRYHLDRKKEEEERKRQEELTAEELRRYEADQTRKDRVEKQRADQYRGQMTRSMEQEGYTRRPTLAGNYGDIAKLLSMRTGEEAARPSPGFTGPMEPEFDLGTYHPDVGSSWLSPPEQTWADITGLVHLGEGQYRNDPTYVNPHQQWQMAQESAPRTPTPLSDRDRMNFITEGWMPEEKATAYDLDTQMPMRDGQPLPVVSGLVAPPMVEPQVDPNPIIFSGAQVVSLAAKAADPFTGGPAIYDELGNAFSALTGLTGAEAGTTGVVSLVDILKDYPTITLTTADLNVLEQILQKQGIAFVRQAIESELR